MAIPQDINTSKENSQGRDYTNIPPIPDSVWKNPIHFIAFGFGVGAIPFAPGTFGTLVAIPFYLLLQPLNTLQYVGVTLLIMAASIWICEKTSEDIQVEDHQGMCLDEMPGFLVTMIGAPFGWYWILLGFILFRLFDIWKPWPIRWVDKNIHGGVGMVLDDVLAGIVSCFCVQIVAQLIL